MKTKIQSAAIAVATVLTAGSLSAETVAWYHFNDLPSGEVPTGGALAITNAVNPGAMTAHAHSFVNATTELAANSSYIPIYTNAFPSGVTWLDPATGKKGSDGRSLFFRSSSGDGRFNGGVAIVDDDSRLHVSQLTVELFYKFKLTGEATAIYTSPTLVAQHASATENKIAWKIYIAKDSSDPTKGLPSVTISDKNRSVTDATIKANLNLFDGKWHHLALTYDGQYLKGYCDYKQVIATYDCQANGCLLDYKDGGTLTIGASDKSQYYRNCGFIDEVRISNEVLPVEKFLRPGGYADGNEFVTDEDTVFYSSLENVAVNDEPLFGNTNVPCFFNETTATNAAKPTIVLATSGITPLNASVVSNQIHYGRVGTSYRVNSGCWSFGENTVTSGKSVHITVDDYSMNGGTHLITSGDFTIEFWLKVGAATAQNRYIVGEQSGARSGGTMLIYVPKNSNSLLCRLASKEEFEAYEADKDNTMDFLNIEKEGIADDKWHHVALVVNKAANTAAFFVDRRLVGSVSDFTLASSLATTDKYKPLQISGYYGPDRNDEFENLAIDELRITRRALERREFLRVGPASPLGCMIIIR